MEEHIDTATAGLTSVKLGAGEFCRPRLWNLTPGVPHVDEKNYADTLKYYLEFHQPSRWNTEP